MVVRGLEVTQIIPQSIFRELVTDQPTAGTGYSRLVRTSPGGKLITTRGEQY